MAINKKTAKERMTEKGLDKKTANTFLGFLELLESDFEKEIEKSTKKIEDEFERAKQKRKEKITKAENVIYDKFINQFIKEYKIKVPKNVGFSDISKAKEIYGQENQETNSQNVESINRDFNHNQNGNSPFV